ncbi:trigger factor [Pseudobutyrivibrio ruminis DSM 9787]|uniref:Trigger factor n=1 Tax=Pseudobutyrivibrio ruminis DSM 9787 TaxID=1123011 RepID=A0A285SEX7_9FIRM|nr:trigger factor [Pseudobutyrivibrio ruminis]SOC06447.1 trigger factor [Pseudobutyrivibrio ruminis DSM 9787]
MNVQVENLEKNMAKLTITVDAAELEKAITKAYNKQKNSISVPGFRKGKVPQNMVEKMYGAEIFYEDAANIIMQDTYPQAYDESKLDIVSQPKIDITQLEKGKDFIYTAEVAVKPEVKLGKYKGVSVTKIDSKVTATEVNNTIKAELERAARTVTKTGKAAKGDTTVIDFEGFIDGVAFEGGKGENYDLELGSGSFIPGFEDQLIGHKAGEDVDVEVTFPENYQAEDLAGKPAVFKCHIHEVKGKDIPKLDDEYVADTTEFETVEEYKASVKERLENNKKAEGRRAQEDEAIAKIVEDSEMEIPDAMLDYQVENMINDFANNMAQQGLSLQQYMQFTGMTMDSFREQVRPDALSRTQSSLVLEAIAKAEKIEVADADVDAKLEEMSKQYGMELDQIKNLVGESEKESMKKDIAIEKAIELIMDNVKESARKKATKKADDAEADAAEEKPAKKTTAKKTTTKKTTKKADDAE